MRFEKTDGKVIPDTRKVKVKQMNHITEVKALDKLPKSLNGLLRLSKTEYLVKDTGEVKEYNLSDNRGQNKAGLSHTFRKIRDLINTNFTGAGNELHLTLTYAENMTDTIRLHDDFKKFWQRYKRKYGQAEYLSVVEPQGRGAWHCHVLIKHPDKDRIFIPANELAEIWGQGFITVKSLEGVDNIGAYLSAYLGDIELTEDTQGQAQILEARGQLEVKRVTVDGKPKAFIKGGRLHMYPPGMNLYRHSKGIKFPEEKEMSFADAKKIVGSDTPNYSRTITIYDDDGNVLNSITYVQYNSNRKTN